MLLFVSVVCVVLSVNCLFVISGLLNVFFRCGFNWLFEYDLCVKMNVILW